MRFCEPFDDPWTEWITEDCDLRATCIPFNATTGVCSCSHSMMMLSTSLEGQCVPSISTYILASYWLILSFITLVSGLRVVVVLWRAFRAQKLPRDGMSFSGALLVTANISNSVDKTIAALRMMRSTDEYSEELGRRLQHFFRDSISGICHFHVELRVEYYRWVNSNN